MVIRRAAPQASVAEVLDRVLDRGIVIDAWLRVSVAGIALLDV
ncbi:MAG: gas vesicle protein GvpJ, partial [Candidatus Rokuibacteriota bacterium]